MSWGVFQLDIPAHNWTSKLESLIYCLKLIFLNKSIFDGQNILGISRTRKVWWLMVTPKFFELIFSKKGGSIIRGLSVKNDVDRSDDSAGDIRRFEPVNINYHLLNMSGLSYHFLLSIYFLWLSYFPLCIYHTCIIRVTVFKFSNVFTIMHWPVVSDLPF